MLLALGIGARGGSEEASVGGSEEASVGDCIDADENVVDCASSEATHELVSDQSEPDAIACIAIDVPPQEEVTVGDTTYCAEPK